MCLFDKYSSNWRWEKQMTKEYMWKSKALYRREWRWPFLTTHDWLTSHCKAYQQPQSITQTILQKHQQMLVKFTKALISPGLTRISEIPKYTHKSTDDQSIQKVRGAWGLSQRQFERVRGQQDGRAEADISPVLESWEVGYIQRLESSY